MASSSSGSGSSFIQIRAELAGLSHGAPDSRCSSPTRSVDGKKKRTFWRKNRPSHPRETPPNDHPNRSKSNETSFYVIQYKKNVLPVEAECIYYIKNLIVEEPNRYYGVNLDFEEDIQDINKVIAQEKDKFRIRNSPGMGWACLVKDQSGQLRRGIVFEFLAEEIAVYLVDTGDTITVPIGSTQIIPEGNKLLTLPPLAIRFAIKDLPDEYPMGRQEMVNLVEFCNKNHMHVKLLNVLEKERDPYGAFVVNLYVRSKNGTEDVAKLIKDGQFKPGNVASQASQPSGSCHIEVTADRPSGSVSRQQTESQRSQFERPQVSSDVRVSGLAQQQRQEALPESASASSETWILSPKHPTQRQDTLPQVQAVQKPARPPRKLQDVLPPAEPFQESNIPAGSHNADSESRSKVLGPKCDYCDSTGHALRFCKKREADLLEEKMQRSKELFAGVKPTTAARDDAYWKDFNGRFKFSRKWADSRRPRRPQATERPQSSVEDEDNWDVDPEDKEDKPSAVVEEPNAHETSKASSTASEPYEAQSVPSSLEMKHMTRNYVAKSDIRSATPCRYCDDPRHSFNYCKKRESDDIKMKEEAIKKRLAAPTSSRPVVFRCGWRDPRSYVDRTVINERRTEALEQNIDQYLAEVDHGDVGIAAEDVHQSDHHSESASEVDTTDIFEDPTSRPKSRNRRRNASEDRSQKAFIRPCCYCFDPGHSMNGCSKRERTNLQMKADLSKGVLEGRLPIQALKIGKKEVREAYKQSEFFTPYAKVRKSKQSFPIDHWESLPKKKTSKGLSEALVNSGKASELIDSTDLQKVLFNDKIPEAPANAKKASDLVNLASLTAKTSKSSDDSTSVSNLSKPLIHSSVVRPEDLFKDPQVHCKASLTLTLPSKAPPSTVGERLSAARQVQKSKSAVSLNHRPDRVRCLSVPSACETLAHEPTFLKRQSPKVAKPVKDFFNVFKMAEKIQQAVFDHTVSGAEAIKASQKNIAGAPSGDKKNDMEDSLLEEVEIFVKDLVDQVISALHEEDGVESVQNEKSDIDAVTEKPVLKVASPSADIEETSEETKPPVLENLTPTLIAKPVDLSPEALERTESKVTPEDVRQDDLSEHLVEEDSQKDGVESVQAEETVDTAVVNAVLEATSTSTEIENTSEETEPAVLEHLTPTVIDRPVDVSQEALEKAERQNSAKEDSQEDQKTHARDAQESQSPELVKETAEKHVDDSKATEQSERQATPENAQNKEDDHKAAIFQNEKTVDKSEVSTDVNSEPLQVNGQVSLTEEVETEDSVATNHCGREDPKKIDYRVLSDDAVQENVQEPLTEEAETTAVKLRIQKIAESLAEAEEVHESFEADVCKDSRAYRATNISQEPTVSEEAKDLAAEEAREQQIAEDRLLDALKESDSKVTSIKEASSEDFEASSEDELYTKLMEDWVSFVSDEILALVIATCERLLPEVDLSLPVAETGTPKDGDTIQLQNMLTDVTVNVIGVLGYAVTVQDDFVTMLTEEDPVETNDLAETVWPSYLTPYLDVTDVYHEEQQEQEEGLALVNSECSSIASISDDEARSVGKYVRGRGCFGVDPDDLVTVVESDHSSREESEGTLSQADLEDLKEEIQADNEEDDEPVKNASQQLKGTKDHSQSEDEFEVIQEAVAKDSEDVEILKNGAEPPERSEDQSELESKPKKDLEAVAMNSENIDAFKKASENPTATVDEGRSEAKFEEIQKAAIKKPELVEGVKSFKEGSEPPKSIADQSQPEVKLEDTQQSVAEGSAPVKEIDVFKQIPRSLRKSEDKTEPEIEPEENLEVVAGSSDNVKTSENASEAPLATKIHSEPEEPKAEPLSKDTDLSEISQEDQEVKQATTNTNDNDWSSSRKTLEVQVQKPKKEKRRFPTPEPEVVDPEEEDWFDSAPPEDEPAGSYLNPTDSKRAQIAAILATVQQPKTATAKNTYFPQSQGSSTSTSGITLGAEPSGCWKCGLKDHFQRDCPHPRPKCYRCDEFGHKAFECVAVAKMNRLWNRAGLYGGPRKWKGSEDTE